METVVVSLASIFYILAYYNVSFWLQLGKPNVIQEKKTSEAHHCMLFDSVILLGKHCYMNILLNGMEAMLALRITSTIINPLSIYTASRMNPK